MIVRRHDSPVVVFESWHAKEKEWMKHFQNMQIVLAGLILETGAS